MSVTIPPVILEMLSLAEPSWRPALRAGLEALAAAHPAYLGELLADSYLPTEGRLFAAFAQPLPVVRYVLVGEGPYPRPESATGFCFMDGAVQSLWSAGGLSKQVNRATSLRNFMKMLLVADGRLAPGHTSGDALAHVAAEANAPASGLVQTLAQLQQNLGAHGFLLLNAALVYRPHVPPLKEAKAWQPFLQCVLAALADHARQAGAAAPTLVLWGKIAEQLQSVPALAQFPQAVSEHPYNLSFILNPTMQALFAPMHLLQGARARQD
ncbi:uracil-DNA glycosylase [Noviherbaspirillum sedimenti]|uniref:Uracil-DNA glycosylase n=1 Tax=Noviherbaspirillum sedimenti TaxID=2320865 RepID=A0A3A3G842_9BURK|nr:uracil-DNA glycosylase [Noviherbaspirillum sedimenti]RJG04141.1 uracil-DNA glycosylase [Noviherbaspirillum sedimenti]